MTVQPLHSTISLTLIRLCGVQHLHPKMSLTLIRLCVYPASPSSSCFSASLLEPEDTDTQRIDSSQPFIPCGQEGNLNSDSWVTTLSLPVFLYGQVVGSNQSGPQSWTSSQTLAEVLIIKIIVSGGGKVPLENKLLEWPGKLYTLGSSWIWVFYGCLPEKNLLFLQDNSHSVNTS